MMKHAVVPVAALLLAALFAPTAGADPLDLSADGGAIVFTFNEGLVSQLDAARMLEARGDRATFYVTSGQLRSGSANAGHVSAAEVADLAARGHDIESFGVSKVNLRSASDARLEAELADSQAALEALVGEPVRHIAYPFGATDARVIEATSRYYDSGRVVTTQVGEFSAAIDSYQIPGLMLMKSTTIAKAKSFVNYAANNDVTVVFSLDRIVSNPTKYDWTPAKFSALLDHVHAKGVPVRTLAELFGPAPPPPEPTPPGAPTLSATAGVERVDLSWTTPANGGSAITGYRLWRGTTSGGETLLATLGPGNTYADTSVTVGTRYYYQVSATNAIGEGARSNEASAVPQSTPPPPSADGTIIFAFDDGYADGIGAANTLATHGFRGTYYLVRDWLGESGMMTTSQAQALSSAGHDVQSHTLSHPDLTRASSSELTAELRDSQAYFQTLVGEPVRHLAYPFGAHDADVRSATASYYTTGRIYLGGPSPSDLPTLLAQSGSDPYLRPGIGILKTTSLATAKAYVDYAVQNDVTLELTFHNIEDGGDTYSWSPANFAALVDYADQTGVSVETVAEAYG